MASPSPKTNSLLNDYLHKSNPNGDNTALLSQFEYRESLIAYWGITPGSRILEIGCGQGDCTLVLADTVGETGHIDALDPGSPDYGSPFTLSQSQSHILSSPLGPRITFHNTSTPSFLASLPPSSPPYDFIIFAHSIYYFESPSTFSSLLPVLPPHARKLCIAEWALRSRCLEGVPHVLTALLLGALEARRKVPGSGNVRTVLSPKQIKEAVLDAVLDGKDEGNGGERKWKLEKEMKGEGNKGMLDGYWEVSDTLRKRGEVLGEIKREGVGEKELGAFEGLYDGVEEAVGVLGEEAGVRGVRCMDFWAGIFEVSVRGE